MEHTPAILELMIRAAEEAAHVVREQFRTTRTYQDKSSHQDIVTETDRQSEARILTVLRDGMSRLGYTESNIGFITEEQTTDQVQSTNFIIDPIDGTSNFSSGIPHVAIAIGFAEGEKTKLGVVLNPFTRTAYWGERNNGAYCRQESAEPRRLKLAQRPMDTWLVAAHFNGTDVAAEQFALYQRLYPHVRGLRNAGSLILDLCSLADDALAAVLNKKAFLWDIAAAGVIVEEAGGALYDLAGNPLSLDWQHPDTDYDLAACYPSSAHDLFDILQSEEE